jgi:hypothetical protein
MEDLSKLYKVPEVSVREMEANPHYPYAKLETEKWISKFIGIDWKDTNDLVGWAGYLHLNCNDRERMVLIAKIDTWAFILDDYLDKNPSKVDPWLQVLREEKSKYGSPLEKMLDDFLPQIKKDLTVSQHKRFLDGWINFVDSYKKVHLIKSGQLKVDFEEHMKLRFDDSARGAMFVLAEYGLGINMDQFSDCQVLNDYHDYATKHALLFNDLISFEKEYVEDGAKYNIILMLSERKGLSFQEAAHMIAKELSELDVKILESKRKIAESGLNIPVKYLEEIDNFKDGNVFWSKICGRYKC